MYWGVCAYKLTAYRISAHNTSYIITDCELLLLKCTTTWLGKLRSNTNTPCLLTYGELDCTKNGARFTCTTTTLPCMQGNIVLIQIGGTNLNYCTLVGLSAWTSYFLSYSPSDSKNYRRSSYISMVDGEWVEIVHGTICWYICSICIPIVLTIA